MLRLQSAIKPCSLVLRTGKDVAWSDEYSYELLISFYGRRNVIWRIYEYQYFNLRGLRHVLCWTTRILVSWVRIPLEAVLICQFSEVEGLPCSRTPNKCLKGLTVSEFTFNRNRPEGPLWKAEEFYFSCN